MQRPVILADGFTYEESAIKEWLERGNTVRSSLFTAKRDWLLSPGVSDCDSAMVCACAEKPDDKCGTSTPRPHSKLCHQGDPIQRAFQLPEHEEVFIRIPEAASGWTVAHSVWSIRTLLCSLLLAPGGSSIRAAAPPSWRGWPASTSSFGGATRRLPGSSPKRSCPVLRLLQSNCRAAERSRQPERLWRADAVSLTASRQFADAESDAKRECQPPGSALQVCCCVVMLSQARAALIANRE